jgi:hypothetical protein
MSFNTNGLSKISDKLDKQLENKAHFDRKEQRKQFVDRLDRLIKAAADQSDINELQTIKLRQIYDTRDKLVLDRLENKYCN